MAFSIYPEWLLRFDRFDNARVVGCNVWRESGHDFSIPIEHKFLEVPKYICSGAGGNSMAS